MQQAPASAGVFASLAARSVAGGIDVALLVLLAALAQRVSGGHVQVPDTWFMVLSAGYFILAYSSAGNGCSLGKRLLSIRVVNRDGDPLSLVASAVRWAILMGVGAPLSFVIVNLERYESFGVAPAMAIAE
jgi:RDD family.